MELQNDANSTNSGHPNSAKQMYYIFKRFSRWDVLSNENLNQNVDSNNEIDFSEKQIEFFVEIDKLRWN